MVYQYPHPEMFSKWKQVDLKVKSGNLILWGAGKIGGIAAHCLNKQGISFAVFCDVAKDKWGKMFCGHKIISPEELFNNYVGATVLISNVFYDSVKPMLLEKGFTDVLDCSSLFMKIDFSDYDFWMNPKYAIRVVEQYLAAIHKQITKDYTIDQIFLTITTKCTLRCKHCSQFVAYDPSPTHYKKENILEDFNKSLNCLGHIRVVNFYGGEPLLHPQLALMIRDLYDEKRIERISIVTNATLLPSEEVLWTIKQEKRFLVRVSNYGVLSSRLNELVKLLDQNNIQYEVTNYTYWDKSSRIGFVDESPEELASKFKLCTSCNILHILNRRGYLCNTCSAVCNLDGFPESTSNYLDMSAQSSLDEFKKEVLQFISRPLKGEYLDACRYCTGMHGVQFENKIPVAEQADGLLRFEKCY